MSSAEASQSPVEADPEDGMRGPLQAWPPVEWCGQEAVRAIQASVGDPEKPEDPNLQHIIQEVAGEQPSA